VHAIAFPILVAQGRAKMHRNFGTRDFHATTILVHACTASVRQAHSCGF
jgi:hypothetical protein